MEPSDIDHLAPLFDMAFHSWDINNPDVQRANLEFHKILGQLYAQDCPDGDFPFNQYRLQAVRKCKAWLAKGN